LGDDNQAFAESFYIILALIAVSLKKYSPQPIYFTTIKYKFKRNYLKQLRIKKPKKES